jgi:hypothetical protein
MSDSFSDDTRPHQIRPAAATDSTRMDVVDDTGRTELHCIVDADEPAHYVNSVDATSGQPIVARVMMRKQELETALAELPAENGRARTDLELALSTIGAMLTGDLANVPHVVVVDMSRWLERTKHLAERAPVSASASAS